MDPDWDRLFWTAIRLLAAGAVVLIIYRTLDAFVDRLIALIP